MDIMDCLSGNALRLPKMRDAATNFLDYLRGIYSAYLDEIAKLDAQDPITKCVTKHSNLGTPVCTMLLEAVEVYLQGFPHLAYEKVASAIATLGPHFKALYTVGDMQKNLRWCYRIQSADDETLSRERLFHIPFQLRHKVATQRYSIPGLPSLYLGGSVYVCWEEYGRPPLDDIHIARFEAVDKLRIVNFGYHPERMAAMAADAFEKGKITSSRIAFLVAQTISWPLLASCSLQVPDRKVAFKDEYIIPQIVLQWVRMQKDFDGIRYFSTHVDDLLRDPVGQINYVFPVQKPIATGYCESLKAKFHVSMPFACRTFSNGVLAYADCPHLNFKIRRAGTDDEPTDYRLTDIGQIQQHIASLPTAAIV